MREMPISYKKSLDSWQIKVQVGMQRSVERYLKLLFPFPWLIIAGDIFCIGYLIIYFYESNSDMAAAVRMVAIRSVLIAALANAVVFFENLLDEIADTLPDLIVKKDKDPKEWVREWYDYIFWSYRSAAWGIGLGLVCAAIGIYIIPKFFSSVPGQVYGYCLSFCVGFLGGSMLWIMLGIAGLTWCLGKEVDLKSSIFDSNTSALRAVSSVLWKVSLVAALLYVLGMSQVVLCSIKLPPPAKVLAVAFGLFVIFYFIVPQINIHKTLLRIKQKRLRALVKQIDSTFDKVTENPTHENISKLRELFDIQGVLNGKQSWAFGMKELLMLISSIVIPLVIFAADCLIHRLNSTGGGG